MFSVSPVSGGQASITDLYYFSVIIGIIIIFVECFLGTLVSLSQWLHRRSVSGAGKQGNLAQRGHLTSPMSHSCTAGASPEFRALVSGSQALSPGPAFPGVVGAFIND